MHAIIEFVLFVFSISLGLIKLPIPEFPQASRRGDQSTHEVNGRSRS